MEAIKQINDDLRRALEFHQKGDSLVSKVLKDLKKKEKRK